MTNPLLLLDSVGRTMSLGTSGSIVSNMEEYNRTKSVLIRFLVFKLKTIGEDRINLHYGNSELREINPGTP